MWFNRAIAISLAIHHMSVVANNQHRPGSSSLADRVIDYGIENGEMRITRSLRCSKCGS